MSHNQRIWTGSVRRMLYRRIKQQFGPYATWEKSGSPGRDLDDEFHLFCEAFARLFGAKSGKAVEHQIRFACPETNGGSIWKRHAQTAILNKAAALEEDFIEDRHLSVLLAVGRDGTDL